MTPALAIQEARAIAAQRAKAETVAHVEKQLEDARAIVLGAAADRRRRLVPRWTQRVRAPPAVTAHNVRGDVVEAQV